MDGRDGDGSVRLWSEEEEVVVLTEKKVSEKTIWEPTAF